MSTAIIRASMTHPSLLSPSSFDEIFKQLNNFTEEKDSFPLARVKLNKNNLLIQLALAGYPKEKISIDATLNQIEIKGEKINDPDSLYACRAFTWSRKDINNVWDFSASKVEYINGLLKVTVPKQENAKKKAILID